LINWWDSFYSSPFYITPIISSPNFLKNFAFSIPKWIINHFFPSPFWYSIYKQ
jgi:hypothetical protein